MQTQPAITREAAADKAIALTDLKPDTLALLHAQYVDATVARMDITTKDFEFRIPRAVLIDELRRMKNYLESNG